MFLLVCKPVRVVQARGRFHRNVLVRIVKWESWSEKEKFDFEFDEKEEEEELPPKHAFAVLRDDDVLGSVEPRLEYEVLVEQAEGAAWPLEEKYRKRQAEPPARSRTEPCPSGQATVFLARRVRSVWGVPSVPTFKVLSDVLPGRLASELSQTHQTRGEGGRRVIDTFEQLAKIVGSLKTAKKPAERLLPLETLGDCWMPAAYTHFLALHLVKPSSLSQLRPHEFRSLISWVHGVVQEHGDQARAWPLGAVADLVDPAKCAVFGPLVPATSPGEGPVWEAVGKMRATFSTVLTCPGDQVPTWMLSVGALVPIPSVPQTYTTGRALRLQTSLLQQLSKKRRVHFLTTSPGRPLEDVACTQVRVLANSLFRDDESFTISWVVPTPGHAPDFVDALSYEDVLMGRLVANKRGVLCILEAHAFGLSTLEAVISAAEKYEVIVMVGDRIRPHGPARGDPGAPFRDLCVQAIKLAPSSGVFAVDRVVSSPAWSDPLYAWPAADFSCVTVCRPDDAAIGAHGLLHIGQTSRPFWAVGPWGALPEWGWVGPVLRAGVLWSPGNLEERAHEIGDALPLRSRLGCVQISNDNRVDHSHCCGARDLVRLETHPTFRSLEGFTTARHVARWTGRPVADSVVLHVSDATTLQEVRAAALLARRTLFLVTPDGTLAPGFLSSKYGARPHTNFLLGNFPIERDDDYQQEIEDAAEGTQVLQVPCHLHLIGGATDARFTTTPREARARLLDWLSPTTEEKPAAAPAPVVAEVSRGFRPPSRQLLESLTRHEADALLEDRMTKLEIGKEVAATARDDCVIHLLAVAARGNTAAEQWFLRAEGALVCSSDRERHCEAIRSHLFTAVVAVPDANPIDDEESPAFHFYQTLLRVRSRMLENAK